MKFNFEATGIGSLPFRDPSKACETIFNNLENIPFWPQLPRRSFFENMYVQFSEGLPGMVLDEENKTAHIDTSKVAAGIESVYGKYLEGDIEFFKISENYAQGFYKFMELFKASPGNVKYVKGQITGPVSYALSVTDQNKRSVIYNKDLFEVLTKVLIMKARWQIKRLKKIFPNVIIFIDEPYLVSIGSSFVNINIEESIGKLDEVIAAISADGALTGVHCCGNTDWSLLLKRSIDIINFDAYNFSKEFSLYGPDIKEFLRKGGTIAWGVIPSSDAIAKENTSTLIEKLKSGIKLLADKGIKGQELSSIITPSCGLGTVDEDSTNKILDITRVLSNKLKKAN